jgi:hypothetical protein
MDGEFACRGYLAKVGLTNIVVRLLLADNEIERPDLILRACEENGIELHETYQDVLDKLENKS